MLLSRANRKRQQECDSVRVDRQPFQWRHYVPGMESINAINERIVPCGLRVTRRGGTAAHRGTAIPRALNVAKDDPSRSSEWDSSKRLAVESRYRRCLSPIRQMRIRLTNMLIYRQPPTAKRINIATNKERVDITATFTATFISVKGFINCHDLCLHSVVRPVSIEVFAWKTWPKVDFFHFIEGLILFQHEGVK